MIPEQLLNDDSALDFADLQQTFIHHVLPHLFSFNDAAANILNNNVPERKNTDLEIIITFTDKAWVFIQKNCAI